MDLFKAPKKLLKHKDDGFIEHSTLNSLLDQLCSKIKHPITLIFLDESDNLQRMDSTRVGFLLDEACDTFRKFGGHNACIENDNNHAKPYLLDNKAIPDCGYEMYRCEYMGYQEYIFPISVENNTIAVLFVGQIQTMNDEYIISTKKRCIEKYKSVLMENVDKIKNKINITFEDVSERILSERKDPFLQINVLDQYDVNINKKLFKDQSSVNRFINNELMPQIQSFKSDIIDALYTYRKERISDTIYCFEESYNNNHINYLKNYDNLEEDGDANIDDYWENLRALFVKLSEKLQLKEITYYEQSKTAGRKESDLYEIKITTNSDSYGKEVVLQSHLLKQHNYIVDERAHIKYVMKVEFYEENLYSSQLKEYLTSELSRSMKATLDICSYAIHSKLESNANLTTLRIYRHEMDQLIFTLDSINYKLSSDYREELDDTKIEKMHKDFESSLQSATYMSKNIEYFTRSQQGIPFNHEPKEYINIFNKLNKWRLFVMSNVINKKSSIIVPSEEERRKRMNNISHFLCVEEGLESILYNIINNAIKYCYRGSNIYLDCHQRLIDGAYHPVITVTDYGRGINPKHHNDIFKLYYRDVDSNVSIDGSGIGLYLSKLIADAIGVKIDYTSELVSEYNVPLLEKALTVYKYESDKYSMYKEEYDTFDISELEEIVCPFSQKITARGVRNDINTPTYKVTFEVII